MKINFNKQNIIFKVCTVVICLIFNIIIYIESGNFYLLSISLLFSIIVVGEVFIYERMFRRYMSDILIQLSEMLEIITEMKEKEVFPIIEDSMFSKLQFQTIKLMKILKSQNKKIEIEKNEIKTLISDIAHQLKTPLSNVRMYSELLQDNTLDREEREEFSKVILVSLDKLSFLIESMIKMSRLETGVIQLKTSVNNLKETVLLAISQVRKKAKSKNIDIKLELLNDVETIHDKNWTAESIFNILENAVKYTGENGQITVRIQSYDIFSRIDIEDNGIGIDEEELPKIFTRFYRGTKVDNIEGIGIGLYLSREIITKQEGYIKVSSNEKGSKFSIFLPNK